MLNAYSTGRAPRTAAMLLVVGGGMIVWAVTQQPNSYSIAELPQVFMRVFAGLIG